MWREHDRLEVEAKAEQDFVSEADRTIEDALRTDIKAAFPSDDIVGEEHGGTVSDCFWSLDPIDGTSNFLRGLPLWGISIAYVVEGHTEVGVIALPALGLFVSADRDGKLTCNKAIVPTRRPSAIRLLAVGDNPYWAPNDIGQLERHLRESGWGVAGYRCASVALAFAALGYTDGYLEKWTNEWDIAAGRLLCAKAGLIVETGTQTANHAAQSWIKAASSDVLSSIEQLWPSL